MSQDGALCVWKSNTQLEELVLMKNQDKAKPLSQKEDEDDDEEDRMEGEDGTIIKGKSEAPKDKTSKNVRYQQSGK